MDEVTFYRLALGLAGVLAGALGVWLFRLNPGKLAAVEPLPRWRGAGAVLGLLALIWCIPHARPIVFNWMLPLLWPMAVAGAVLGYWYLDYLFSRALGGIFILAAYYFVHSSFDFHTPGMAVLAIVYWGLGILGIAFSGKPCWMRDVLRSCCRPEPRYRWLYGSFLVILALLSFAGAALTPGGGVK